MDSRNHAASHAGNKTDSFSTQQAGSNGLLRAAGPGKAAAARSSSVAEATRERSRSGVVALISTG